MASILVIDDDVQLLEAVATYLAASGHEVITATDGREGIRLARERVPDLVLSDVRMQEVDGYEVVRRLQENPATALIPVILMTGYAEQHGMRRAMATGAEDYLTKPFSGQELVQAVEARLRRRQAVARHVERTVDRVYSSLTLALPHELRTPLTAILSGARLLADPDDLPEPERVAAIAKSVLVAGERLYRLVERFLTFAQIHFALARPGQAPPPAVTQRPGAVVAEVASTLAEAANRAQDLKLQLEDGPVAVDPEHLRRVVSEVVENAFKFSPVGSPVHIEAAPRETRWEMVVEDRGSGVRPEQVAELAAGVQLDRAFHEQQGTGLGIGIARGICAIYRGTLRLEPARPRGTRVTVSFPLAR